MDLDCLGVALEGERRRLQVRIMIRAMIMVLIKIIIIDNDNDNCHDNNNGRDQEYDHEWDCSTCRLQSGSLGCTAPHRFSKEQNWNDIKFSSFALKRSKNRMIPVEFRSRICLRDDSFEWYCRPDFKCILKTLLTLVRLLSNSKLDLVQQNNKKELNVFINLRIWGGWMRYIMGQIDSPCPPI